jgi:uncharacterized protein YutD
MGNDKILTRLKKLLDHEASARAINNIAEAETYAAKIQDLLDRYELTMTDVEYAAAKEEDPLGSTYARPTKLVRKRTAWQERLADKIARANHCRIIVHSRSNAITFVGRESHRIAVSYVFVRLVDFAERQSQKDYDKTYNDAVKSYGYASGMTGYRAAWLNGFVNAINDRYKAEREKLEEEMRAAGQGMALIRLENAGKAAQKFLDEDLTKAMKLRNSDHISGRYSNNERGRESGYRAGQSANLRTDGVGKGTGVKGYLT